MSKYIVSLTPLGKYFFGGDTTFKVSDRNDYNERFSSYIIQSGLFPQQTSLLGMLRFLLLSNDENSFNKATQKIISADNAEKIIGPQGFIINSDYACNNFEKIKNISPCFIETSADKSQWIPLLPAPKDYGYSVSFASSVQISFNGKQGNAPLLRGYAPKEWKEDVYIGDKICIKSSEIFIEDPRIGIDKKYDGKTEKDDSSYYKQICYRLCSLKREFRFAFEVEVDDSIRLEASPYQHSVVNIGGDSSQFIFEARRAAEKTIVAYPESYNDEKGFESEYKVILLSDSYLQRSEAANAQYALTHVVPFRFIQTTVNTEDYSILSPTNLRSSKYYLYQKGSVFFCNTDQLSSLEKALDRPCFKQIGYNHYQIIRRSSKL